MRGLNRRRFLQALAVGVLPVTACQYFPSKRQSAQVVVVGGGFGGATLAKYLRVLDAGIRVTLIEPKTEYATCPGSNWLFAGLTSLDRLTFDYQALQQGYGVEVRSDTVVAIEADRRRIRLASGQYLAYDRLLLSPGIGFRWDAIEGYSSALVDLFPHAWQAGAQTRLLARQIQAMPDGGLMLIAAPPDPYRCPPGPYERASMCAYWLKRHKPRAKILILDPKRSFSKQALFEAGWAKHYGYGTPNSLIEWHSLADNPITRLDVAGKSVITEFGDRFSADVINLIPAQHAGQIAIQTGLTDTSGWCPVKPETSQSLLDEYIHVIGDAAQYAPIPKSAFAANSEAKACAFAVVALLNDQPPPTPNWLNTCYSLVTPEHGISVAGVYRLAADGSIMPVSGAGGVSHANAPGSRQREAEYARLALAALLKNTFN